MLRPILFVLAALIAAPSYAHEFWIAPLEYQVDANTEIQAHFRVGQDFAGSTGAWVPRRTTQTLAGPFDSVVPYEGTVGDRPAMTVTPSRDGLFILAHETRDDTLTYRDMTKFQAFIEHKDFKGALARHAERGLPDTGFVETYRRYAKSLVAVGTGAGQDQRLGLDIELVALSNPYAGADTIPVRLWMNDTTVPNAQIEVFERDMDANVTITKYRTNENGIADIPVKPGHTYMVDHVVLIERDGTESNRAVWHSMWANLTFATPG